MKTLQLSEELITTETKNLTEVFLTKLASDFKNFHTIILPGFPPKMSR